jgi:hypothetical protein
MSGSMGVDVVVVEHMPTMGSAASKPSNLKTSLESAIAYIGA